jgi:hypothetical protein
VELFGLQVEEAAADLAVQVLLEVMAVEVLEEMILEILLTLMELQILAAALVAQAEDLIQMAVQVL